LRLKQSQVPVLALASSAPTCPECAANVGRDVPIAPRSSHEFRLIQTAILSEALRAHF